MGLLLFFRGLSNTTPIIWTVKVKWDGASYVNEAAYTTSIDIEMGRDGPFDPITAGKCTIIMDNSSDRFNPWNSGGALYGNLAPGKQVWISVQYGSPNDYTLFWGLIEDIVPSGKLGDKVVTITAYNGWRRAASRNIDLALTAALTDNETLLESVKDASGFMLPLDTVTTLQGSTANFWANAPAGALMEDLVNSELGYLWVGRNGLLYARGRDYAGLVPFDVDDSDLVDIEINQPWDYIVNKAVVTAYPIDTEATADLWTLNHVTYIAPGQSATVWAEFQDSFGTPCAASSVVDPVATTDYTANTQANGGGSDMTGSLTVTPTKYANKAKLVLANTHATTGLYVTLLKIRGDALHSYPATVTSEDATSQTAYGVRERTFDMPWLQDVNTAQDFANALVSFWKDPQKMPVIRMQRNLPLMITANDATGYGTDLFQSVSLSSTAYGIPAEIFLIGKEHFWTGNTMQDLWAEFKLEAFDNRKFWDLGTAGFTELGETTKLGY